MTKGTYGNRNGRARRARSDLAAGTLPASHAQPQPARRPARAHLRNRRIARGLRLLGLGVMHVAVFSLVYWLAFVLRFDLPVPPAELSVFWVTLPLVLAVNLAVFYLAGYYDTWWSHVTFADLIALVRASILSLLVITAINYFLYDSLARIPRTVLVLNCVLGILLLGTVRSSWRLCREHLWPALRPKEGQRTLLVGTDHASGVLAHQIQSQTELPYQIEGLLATDGGEPGKRLGQFPILGHVQDVKEIAAACAATDVLVTAGVLAGKPLRQLVSHCREAGLNLKIIPALEDRLNGDAKTPVRNIEINDLLRREPVALDTAAIGRLIQGASVMVTGAGGSIGSEICRQVLRFHPRALLLVGRGENRIFEIEQELAPLAKSTILSARIADVADAGRMETIFAECRPEVVFHAAAHKHVPLMERNVGEAVRNNVSGTRCVADLADRFGTRNFVLISTDKAVRPCSVMGVSKHVAEHYVLALAQESATRFSVVRFGNVLGSACSVVPIFQKQIRHGGPITVTDPRMTRYFMTIPEASQLVLQAAAMGQGGEIFVLDMGEPVRVLDLARDMVRLSGLPENAIEIVFTGLRPGEKLREELYSADEQTLPTSHPKLRAALHQPHDLSEVRREIEELQHAVHQPEPTLREMLERMVPEFQQGDLAQHGIRTPSH